MAKRPAASQSSNSLRALAPSRDISPSSREGAKARSRVLGEELPRGWTMAELRHLVTDVQPGFACGVHNREGAGVGHLRPMNVTEDGCVSLDVLKYVPEDQVDREQRLARSGDVIFNNTNSPELVGKTALYDLPEPRGFSNHMTRLRCSCALDPAFCAMQLHQNWRIGYFISVCNNHVSQASVSSSVLLNTLMRLPPLAEQRRIVARVDALLARVQAARARLAKVPTLLKRFRQSVLAAACSGELTKDWRNDGANNHEAMNLFQDILTRRRGTFAASNTTGYREASPPIEAQRYDYPKAWAVASMDQLTCMVTSGSRGWAQFYSDSGPLFIRTQNINTDRLRLDDMACVQEPKQETSVQVVPARPLTIRQLIAKYPEMKRSSINGLLRVGETCNIISSPKIGKSWLVADLALSKATGRRWLDLFDVVPGVVVIFDNELHGETIAYRLPAVAKARDITLQEFADRIHVVDLRGRLCDIFGFGDIFKRFETGVLRGALVVVDAFYRVLPKGLSENDNASMAGVYNEIDRYALEYDCSFVLIHHASKGSQSGKAVTDVGAGAGSQARATDTHLILRPHSEPAHFVLEAAVRSWPPVQSAVLRWDWPIWHLASDLDPSKLKPEKTRQDRKGRTCRVRVVPTIRLPH